MQRDKAINTINELPQEFELEELLEKLIFIEKVEKGLHQVQTGQTISHSEAKDSFKKW